MRTPQTAGTAAAALGAAASRASAATARQADVEQLVLEFLGKRKAVQRSERELAEAYAQVIETLISAGSFPAVEGHPKHALEAIIIRAGAPGRQERREPLVRAMLAYLTKTKDLNERIFLLRQLGVVGRGQAVPTLARLLRGEQSAVRGYALRALQMNCSPAAGRTVADALAHAGEPRWRIALIGALGSRREASAVSLLSRFMTAGENDVAEAATMALGNIGTPAAAKVLAAARAKPSRRLPPYLVRASLLCADRLAEDGKKAAAAAVYRELYDRAAESLFRMAALRGLALTQPDAAVPLVVKALGSNDSQTQAQAARVVVEIPGPRATKAFLAAVPKLPPSAQAFLLEALAERPGGPAGKRK